MNITRWFFLSAISCILLCACKKEAIHVFDSSDYLYINLDKVSGTNYAQTSYTFTFSDTTVKEKQLEIPVKLAGRYAAQDRNFTISVVDSSTTAIRGTHFELPKVQKIAAGKSEGKAVILLKRTDDLKTTTYQVMLQIVSDDVFKSGHISLVKVLFSDRLIQPNWWNSYARFLGDYSDLKCRLWLEYMKITDGSDPLSVLPYIKQVFNGLAYVTSPNDATIKSTMIGFKIWLQNDKQNPFDPVLNKTVVESLGTSF